MNKNYNLKLDLQFRCNNSIMKFNEFDNNTSDFFMRITNGGKLIDIEKAIVVLAVIKPSGKVSSQFVEIENGLVYADLKPNMRDEIGTYTAKAMLILEDERVVTDSISYKVEEDKIFSLLNDTLETAEDFALLTDMLNRLSTIEISEEQRVINEAERILAEENRKIEEAKRVEAELIRQHEEADRAKYDAIRESNENIRKQNESIRLANETNRIDEEAKRVEEEDKRKLAEEERKANYNFMTEDEERRRSEANAHKEAEVLRVQAETNRVNEEAKRRTTEQARVSAENIRVSNENARETNEVARQNNENQRIEAETQRKNRYNSFIADAEANTSNFENYTNTAKVKEEERKSNELDRKSQEARRVSNEVERVSNENTRKANEKAREKNETSRQNIFENKVDEVDKKIIEINTTKDNFISSVDTKVDNKISELDNAKSDMTTTVSNKVNEVETRFNALTSSQQQDAEVIDARVDFKGVAFNSLKERIDYTDKLLRDSTISTVTTESDFTTVEATSNGYFEDVKLEGKTLVNLWDIESISKSGETVVKNNRITVTTTSNIYSNFFYEQKSKFKPLTEYTIIADVYKNTLQSNDSVYITSNSGALSANRDIFASNGGTQFVIKGGGVGRIVKKYTTISDFSEVDYALRGFVANNSQTEGGELELVITVLEGDYTQNPPSYFEGLKSVGQSATTSEDGVDEISVESVNENLIDSFYNVQSTQGAYASNCISMSSSKLIEGIEYTLTVNQNISGTVYYYGTSCGSISNGNLTFVLPQKTRLNDIYPLSIYKSSEDILIDKDTQIQLKIGKNNNVYTPHQSDKKRLLYYNTETQTWEKPILRQWDSIEKHANGKYYYHQRSGEVVLNGSEEWASWLLLENTIGFLLTNTSFKNTTDKYAITAISDKLTSRSINDFKSDVEGIGLWDDRNRLVTRVNNSKLSTQDVQGFKQWLQTNNVTVVYQLAEEKVYECTNIDLITYVNETNYVIESGVLSPKTTLKVHSNISNVVSLLQKKVSLLESNMTKYMITQNRLMLASRYNADTVSFKVDVASFSDAFEYDNDLYELILNNVLVGKDNYNREYIENLIRFYWMDFVISDEMYSTLFEIIEEQHNPKIEEETPLI